MFIVEECSGQCASGNVAHLQAHTTGETCQSRARANASAEIPARNLCVSDAMFYIVEWNSIIERNMCSALYISFQLKKSEDGPA